MNLTYTPVVVSDNGLQAGTYVRILVLEAIIIVLLWLLGRAFAPVP